MHNREKYLDSPCEPNAVSTHEASVKYSMISLPRQRQCRLSCNRITINQSPSQSAKPRIHSRNIFHPSILQRPEDILRQLHQPVSIIPSLSPFLSLYLQTHRSLHLGRIRPRHIPIQPLPPRNPRHGGIGQRDQALVHLRRALGDGLGVAAQGEVFFAVRAAFAGEFLGRSALIN